jgi:hypothetical protein
MIGWVYSSIEGDKKFMRKIILIEGGLLRNGETGATVMLTYLREKS